MIKQRTFEEQIARGIGSQMVLLSIVIEMLIIIGEVEARHFSHTSFTNQV
jgi:hypothetical protein